MQCVLVWLGVSMMVRAAQMTATDPPPRASAGRSARCLSDGLRDRCMGSGGTTFWRRDGVFGDLGDAELDDGLGLDLDGLAGLRVAS